MLGLTFEQNHSGCFAEIDCREFRAEAVGPGHACNNPPEAQRPLQQSHPVKVLRNSWFCVDGEGRAGRILLQIDVEAVPRSGVQEGLNIHSLSSRTNGFAFTEIGKGLGQNPRGL